MTAKMLRKVKYFSILVDVVLYAKVRKLFESTKYLPRKNQTFFSEHSDSDDIPFNQELIDGPLTLHCSNITFFLTYASICHSFFNKKFFIKKSADRLEFSQIFIY